MHKRKIVPLVQFLFGGSQILTVLFADSYTYRLVSCGGLESAGSGIDGLLIAELWNKFIDGLA